MSKEKLSLNKSLSSKRNWTVNGENKNENKSEKLIDSEKNLSQKIHKSSNGVSSRTSNKKFIKVNNDYYHNNHYGNNHGKKHNNIRNNKSNKGKRKGKSRLDPRKGEVSTIKIENALNELLHMTVDAPNQEYTSEKQAMNVLRNIPFNKRILVYVNKPNTSFKKVLKNKENISVRSKGKTTPEFIKEHEMVVYLNFF